MDEKLKQKFYRLENIKLEMASLSVEEEELKAELAPLVPEGKTIETQNGSFSVARRSKWQYSDLTQQRQKEVKAMEKEEQANGKAVETKGDPYIVYRSNKEE